MFAFDTMMGSAVCADLSVPKMAGPRRRIGSASRRLACAEQAAWLDDFIYLHGHSGRRYVFSRTTLERAAHYDHAIFALSRDGRTIEALGVQAAGLGRDGAIYVHLSDCDSFAEALADLDAASC